MLATNLPGVPVVVDKDRVKAGIHAIRKFGADTLLLDDGLQYLRLQHRLDVVLVDSTSPFGNERLLPRGTLREPPKNLKRASYIFVTKCYDGPDPDLIRRIREYNRTAEIIHCRHQPLYLKSLVNKDEELPVEALDETHVGTISGIAVPRSFEEGLRKLGARIELTRRYADHHRFQQAEVDDFIERCLRRDVDMIVTTEKDAVRFPELDENLDVPIYFLRVEIEIIDGQDVWDRCINRIINVRPEPGESRYY